jgi:hypothetical protein
MHPDRVFQFAAHGGRLVQQGCALGGSAMPARRIVLVLDRGLGRGAILVEVARLVRRPLFAVRAPAIALVIPGPWTSCRISGSPLGHGEAFPDKSCGFYLSRIATAMPARNLQKSA